jgi:adenylylsulfate kinase
VGKTTIGALLTERLRARGSAAIFLDGDVLREVYGNMFGHDRAQRLLAGQHYGRICNMLVNQHVHVVCATISMFHEVHEWNRANIKNYIEIFIDVPLPELIARDNKKIYSRGLNGELADVVGIDILPEYPKCPDIIIDNKDGMATEQAVDSILDVYTKIHYSAHA